MEDLFCINEKIKKYKNIVIYGAGKSGMEMFKTLLSYDIKADYFCDSDAKKWGIKVLNTEVISFEELKNIKEDSAVILNRAYFEQISNKLIDAGFQHIFMPYCGITIE